MGIEDELERARPAAPAGGLVDREVAPEHERPVAGHPDRDELPRPRPLGDLGSHERERVIRAAPAGVQDLGSDASHAPTSA